MRGAWLGKIWRDLARLGGAWQGEVWFPLSGSDKTLEKTGVYRTCLERQMFGYLTELGLEVGIDFHEQFPFGNYLLDFAFVQQRRPFRGLDVETDGMLFHSSPKQRQRDGYRTYKLIKGGWQVERFGESFTCDDVKIVLEKHGIL